MSTTKEEEFDVILDMVWGEPAPSNTDPNTKEQAKVFRDALLTALKRTQSESHSSVLTNPETAKKVKKIRRDCLVKLGLQPIIEWVLNIIAPNTEFATEFAYADGIAHAKAMELLLEPKRDEVVENDSLLRVHKKSDKLWVVSFLTKADELADKKLRLIMYDQFGNELVNEPQPLVYDNEKWCFRYEAYLTDEQVQQAKMTITVE